MYLMGIDIGSTNWKVAVYTPEGDCRAFYSEPAVLEYTVTGQPFYNPDRIWEAVLRGIRNCLGRLPDDARIASIGCSSMGESGILLDRQGQWISPATAWFDTSTEEQKRWWDEHLGPEKLFYHTGVPSQHVVSINRIMRVKRHQPDLFQLAAHWLCLADYVAYRLSGVMGMDYSLASRTMALDLRKKTWSREILGIAGIPLYLFPDLVNSGTEIGKVTTDIAEYTGLSVQTAVAAGGHDQLCGALATGAISSDIVLNSIGTAEVIVSSFDSFQLNEKMLKNGFNAGCHVVENTYYIMGCVPCSGGSIEWLRNHLFKDFISGICNQNEADWDDLFWYNLLVEKAARAPFGCEGLYFLPHLRGTINPTVPTAQGGWMGLQYHHTSRELIRSVFEGLSHEMARCLHAVEESSGFQAHEIRAIGGGTRNLLWMQLKADISRKTIRVPSVEEAVCLGAAMLGAQTCGLGPDFEEAIRSRIMENPHHIIPQQPSDLAARFHNEYCRYADFMIDSARSQFPSQ